MRGLRAWLLVVLALLVLGTATLPWILPPLVRWFAIRQIRAASGREATIERVDIDLWRLRVAAVGVRVEGREPGEPALTVDRTTRKRSPAWPSA